MQKEKEKRSWKKNGKRMEKDALFGVEETIQSFKTKERIERNTHTHCVIQLTPKTVLEISSKEGREWGSDCKHAETS